MVCVVARVAGNWDIFLINHIYIGYLESSKLFVPAQIELTWDILGLEEGRLDTAIIIPVW